MRSVRAIILKRMTNQLATLPEGPAKELHKGKIYNFLVRCKRQDGKRSKRSDVRPK